MAAADLFVYYFTMLSKLFLYTSPIWLVVILFFFRRKWSKYPVEAIILERRGKNMVKTNDRLGKFDELAKDGIIYYKFKKTKDTIPITEFDWVIHNVVVNDTLLDKFKNLLQLNIGTLFVYRYGTKQYKPVKIVLDDGSTKLDWEEIRDKKGSPVLVNKYVPIDPRKEMKPLDFVVIDWDNINFMVQEQRASVERRKKVAEFWKQTLIPLAIIGASVVVSIVILKLSMDMGREIRAAGGSSPPPANDNPAEGSKLLGGISGVVTPGQ